MAAKTISIMGLLDLFGDESKSVKSLEEIRWQGKPTCPHCNNSDNIVIRKGKRFTYRDKTCRKEFTVKTKTIMHGSNLPVQKWLITMYLVMTARKGKSSLQLSKELGITRKTAWFMLQRIREACKQGTFQLSKVVEIDETYIGGKEDNKHANKKRKGSQGGSGKAISRVLLPFVQTNGEAMRK